MSVNNKRVRPNRRTLDAGYVNADKTGSPFANVELPHGHKYFQQLRRKLGWRLLLVYVTPLVIVSVYLHYMYDKTLREGIDTHLTSIAENQRNTVDLYLQERIANMRGILGSIEHNAPPPADEMQEVLAELRSDSEAFVDLGLFEPDGTLVSYAGPHTDLQGRDYSEEEWYTRVVSAESRAFISDVYLGFRDEPHFIIAVTRQISGESWTLRASVDPHEFSEFVGRSHLIVEADAFIVNRSGQPQTFCSAIDREQIVPNESLLGVDTSVGEIEVGDTSYLAAVAPLRTSDWSLVVRVPKKQAYAPLRRAEAVVGVILLLTLVVVVIVVLRSTHRLVGRLEAADSNREDLQRQLFNAAKLASVGEVAAGVAHEINNPLAIVYEEVGMMLDTLDPQFGLEPDMDDFQERLGSIQEATLRGRNITRQLLAFSRQDEPRSIALDLNRLVRHALSIKQTEFSVSNIEVVTDLADDLPLVSADRNQMEQVVLNLLNNSRDAINGPGVINVKTSQEGDTVQIWIGDNGCGMSQEVMERIFFPFFTTKVVGKGTGLGLSISYGIVKGLGGKLEVESHLGKGTTIIISLPVGRRSPNDEHSAERSMSR